MRKCLFILFYILILILSGCSMSGEMFSHNSNGKTENIFGKWEIRYAEHKSTGEEYPLQEIYGSGIQYGGVLELKEDGTFQKWIGISDGEVEQHEGNFSKQGNVITLLYDSGKVGKAFYDPYNRLLKVENDAVDAYEFFTSIEE